MSHSHSHERGQGQGHTHTLRLSPRTLIGAQSGVVMSEYLICTIAVAFALFAPIPGLNETAFTFMLDALRSFQANTTYLMSLP